jgi:aspartyl-tRNA(Asn)/glutamyl-tRNA(Gln) amidotransferase subunit B
VELPLVRKQRFIRDYQLPATDAQTFVDDRPLGHFFEAAVIGARNPKAVANWVINNLRAQMAQAQTSIETLKIRPADIQQLVGLVESGKISTRIAQEVFAEMFITGEAAGSIVEKKGLAQLSDTDVIEKFCDDAIAANPGPVSDYKAGKVAALNFLKGQVMKLSKGRANPNAVGEILEQKLKG